MKTEEKHVEEKPARIAIKLNLAPCAGASISHAGVMYAHGVEYEVAPEVARDLQEIERRGWNHESSLHESENKMRRRAGRYA